MRWIIEQDTGGVMKLEEHCTKNGEKEMEVLRTKNPEAHPPVRGQLEHISISTTRARPGGHHG